MRRPRLAAALVVWALAIPVAVIGGVVPAVAGTTAQAVPGTQRLFSVACLSVSACEAVGNLPASAWPNQGAVVPLTNGAPAAPQAVPGTAAIFGVTCPGAGTCEAVGFNSSGVVVPITNGTIGSVQHVAGTTLLGAVACAGVSSTCEAVGESGFGVVVPISNGTAGSAQAVPGTVDLVGVACPSATTCEAVGANSFTSGQGVLVPISNGTAGSAQAVAGTAYLKGVACQSATTCEAVGYNSSGQGLIVPIIYGTPGGARVVPGTASLSGVTCPSATVCEAAGWNNSGGVVAQVAIQTIVSLTFDNGATSQYTLGYKDALAPHAVKATFYVNSGIMGGANHMSWSQLSALASAGQEIGGKTVDGTNLTTLTTSQQVSEICNDRQTLISHGLKPVGFAYPAGAFNTTLESEVQNCGYGNARTAGSLSPAGPTYAETLPPKSWLALRAYAPTGQVTLANLKSLVTGAAAHGGGWVPIVIQKVCSQALDPANYATCTSSSGWVDLANLNTFLSWVQNAGQAGGAPAGTAFGPIGATATTADTTAPVTTISCNGAPCATTAYGAPVSVTLSATDTGSGVASIHYTTDGTTPTLSSPAYTGAFPLTSSATVKYRSWDNVGNAEPTESQTIQI